MSSYATEQKWKCPRCHRDQRTIRKQKSLGKIVPTWCVTCQRSVPILATLDVPVDPSARIALLERGIKMADAYIEAINHGERSVEWEKMDYYAIRTEIGRIE